MTLNVTVPDTVYRQIAELAAWQQVSVERIVAAALAEQLGLRPCDIVLLPCTAPSRSRPRSEPRASASGFGIALNQTVGDLAGWTRVEQMAGRGSRERFLAALDKVPAAEPAPEDRL
jgi:hypothetical protein